MRRLGRGAELAVVVAVVGVVVLLNHEPSAPVPDPPAIRTPAAAAPTPAPSPSLPEFIPPDPPFFLVPEEPGDGDYANAEGMAGYEKVLALQPPVPTEDGVLRGEALAKIHCASCHGATMNGDGAAGRSLDPPPRDLHSTDDYKYGYGLRSTYRTVTYGVEGTGMAPFQGILTAEQVWEVSLYVRRLQNSRSYGTSENSDPWDM